MDEHKTEGISEIGLNDEAIQQALIKWTCIADYEDNGKISALKKRTPGNNTGNLPFAILYINVDDFKWFNSRFGYFWGNRLLEKIGQRLNDLVKTVGILFKLGSDEFIIVLPIRQQTQEAEKLAEHLIQSFHKPFIIDSKRLSVSISIGVSHYPYHGREINQLVKCAGVCMRKAKEDGKNRFISATMPLIKEFVDITNIMEHLETALENDEFELYYQPQYDIKTRKITGAEALLRWHSPQLGEVSPVKFIPVAEESRLIIAIDKWVLGQACAFSKRLQDSGFQLNTSVNISRLSIMQDDFLDSVFETIDTYKIKPQLLELEITESMLIQPYDTVKAKLEKLREKGIHIALDDFGKGYSSLSALDQLPIDTLKIDKSFIDPICSPASRHILVDSVCMIGNEMNLRIVAEGVENERQLIYLKDKSCTIIQGFLFSQPVRPNVLFEMINNNIFRQ